MIFNGFSLVVLFLTVSFHEWLQSLTSIHEKYEQALIKIQQLKKEQEELKGKVEVQSVEIAQWVILVWSNPFNAWEHSVLVQHLSSERWYHAALDFFDTSVPMWFLMPPCLCKQADPKAQIWAGEPQTEGLHSTSTGQHTQQSNQWEWMLLTHIRSLKD